MIKGIEFKNIPVEKIKIGDEEFKPKDSDFYENWSLRIKRDGIKKPFLVTKIGELLHFNIIEYKNLYRALIDGYYYLNNQLDNEKCIRDELKKFYNEESDNYLNKLLYSILSCSEYLYSDELNEIIGIYERNYNTIIPNNINEISCSYYHTPFAEDFVNKNIKIEFECIKRKSFISISCITSKSNSS